jgi:hypothetical protein
MLKPILKRLQTLSEEIEDIKMTLMATIDESFDLSALELQEFMEAAGYASKSTAGKKGSPGDATPGSHESSTSSKNWGTQKSGDEALKKLHYGEEDGEDEEELEGEPGAEDADELEDAEGAEDAEGEVVEPEGDLEDDGDEDDEDLEGDEDDEGGEDLEGDEGEEGSDPSKFEDMEDGTKFKFSNDEEGANEFTKVSPTEYEDDEGKKYTVSSPESAIEVVPDEAPEDEGGEEDLGDLEGDEGGEEDLGDLEGDEGGDEGGEEDLGDLEGDEGGEEGGEEGGDEEDIEEAGLAMEESKGLDSMLKAMIEETISK